MDGVRARLSLSLNVDKPMALQVLMSISDFQDWCVKLILLILLLLTTRREQI
jgi:hypothetical protein